jgi:hypothetical protein
MSSFTLATGRDGCTTRICRDFAMVAIGAKSLMAS